MTTSRYDSDASKWVNDTAFPAVGATLQSAATANGNGNDFTVDGYGVCMLQVTGTFSATITFKASVDGTNFEDIATTNTNTGTIGTTATAAGIFRINCAGYQKVRAVISGYVSGTITVTGRALAVAGTQSSMQVSGSTLPEAQAIPIRNTSKMVISTILNAVSVAAAGNTGAIALQVSTADLRFLIVSIDQQPWNLRISTSVFGGYTADKAYPQANGSTSTYTTTAPFTCIPLVIPGTGFTIDNNLLFKLNNPAVVCGFVVDNASAATATVTVKILDIWR